MRDVPSELIVATFDIISSLSTATAEYVNSWFPGLGIIEAIGDDEEDNV